MDAFQLDTSGAVITPHSGDPDTQETVFWSDLDAFAQGYVEALFHSSFGGDLQRDGTWKMRVGFSDLAPETLARIIADCRSGRAMAAEHSGFATQERAWGSTFWDARQNGKATKHFGPLTAYLGDDGRVYLREAA